MRAQDFEAWRQVEIKINGLGRLIWLREGKELPLCEKRSGLIQWVDQV